MLLSVMCVAVSLLLLPSPVAASTVTLRVSQLRGNLTAALRERAAHLGPADHLVLYFDRAGTFTIEGTVEFACNVEIKGLGVKKTTVVLDNGTDRAGFKAFFDDTFFKVSASTSQPLAVSIHDLSVKLKDHNGIWWDGAEKYAFKLCNCAPVSIERFNCTLRNAVCTNVDLRACSNVTVRNCTLTNYNNCTTGGVLWLRGQMHDIDISANTFYKYGNDECVAFFGADAPVPGDIKRYNIKVADNDFYYVNRGNGPADLVNGVFFTYYVGTSTPATVGCASSNVDISGNRFYMQGLCHTIMGITFSERDTHDNVVIANNYIENSPVASDQKIRHCDYEVTDLNAARIPITFSGNTTVNNAAFVAPWGASGYCHLMVHGGAIVDLDKSSLTDNVATSSLTTQRLGCRLLSFDNAGGTVNMTGNSFSGLGMLASIDYGDGIDGKVTINADSNVFTGDTRIYCRNVKTVDLNFVGNTFNSTTSNFFLQEFAQQGSLVFDGNMVNTPGNGQLMTHWDNNDKAARRFNKLQVRNNVFTGVDGERTLLQPITNVRSRSVAGNVYR